MRKSLLLSLIAASSFICAAALSNDAERLKNSELIYDSPNNAFQSLSVPARIMPITILDEMNVGKWNNTTAGRILRTNEKQLDALRKVANYKYCIPPEYPDPDKPMDLLEHWRGYAQMSEIAVEYALRNARHEAAIQTLHSALALSDMLLKYPQSGDMIGGAALLLYRNIIMVERMLNQARLITINEYKQIGKLLPPETVFVSSTENYLNWNKEKAASVIQLIRDGNQAVMDAYEFPKNQKTRIRDKEFFRLLDRESAAVLDCVKRGQTYTSGITDEELKKLTTGTRILLSQFLPSIPSKAITDAQKVLKDYKR